MGEGGYQIFLILIKVDKGRGGQQCWIKILGVNIIN
jgi:hypothetical protein